MQKRKEGGVKIYDPSTDAQLICFAEIIIDIYFELLNMNSNEE